MLLALPYSFHHTDPKCLHSMYRYHIVTKLNKGTRLHLQLHPDSKSHTGPTQALDSCDNTQHLLLTEKYKVLCRVVITTQHTTTAVLVVCRHKGCASEQTACSMQGLLDSTCPCSQSAHNTAHAQTCTRPIPDTVRGQALQHSCRTLTYPRHAPGKARQQQPSTAPTLKDSNLAVLQEGR